MSILRAKRAKVLKGKEEFSILLSGSQTGTQKIGSRMLNVIAVLINSDEEKKRKENS